MKKQALLKSLLILLPILAVGLATTLDSVLVFDRQAGTTEYYSYFDLLPVDGFQVVTPLAALLSLTAGILAAIYLGKKKLWSLKAVTMVSLAAAIAAVLPIVSQGNVMIVPNVGLPIFMLLECLLSYMITKKPECITEPKEKPRLKRK